MLVDYVGTSLIVKPQCSEEILSQDHFSHQKSYVDYPEIELCPPQRYASLYPYQPRCGSEKILSQDHFSHQKSYVDCPEMELCPPQ
jgi:superoxide dismutase